MSLTKAAFRAFAVGAPEGAAMSRRPSWGWGRGWGWGWGGVAWVVCVAVVVVLVLGGSAWAESLPRVNDRPAFASDVSQFSATLNATVNPEGIPTSWHFAYGTSGSFGLVAPFPDSYVPVNEEDDAVTQVLVELAPGTTYHFAVVANSPAGEARGSDETFTTPPVPAPGVATGGASEVGLRTATLSGSVNPEGFQAGYFFEYGPGTAYGQRWPSVNVELGAFASAQGVVTFLQNLQPGTLYHYRLVATNPGASTYGTDQTFQTQEYPASIVQEAPVLKTPLGASPETKPSLKAPKHKAKKRKKTKRKASRRRKKR
jgi:hypothetical protein